MRPISSLLVAALVSLPAAAQDSNTASKVRGTVNDRAEEGNDRAMSAGDVEDEGAAEEPADEGAATEEQPTEGGDAPAAATEGGAEPAPNAPESYTVQPGDTLWGLSQRFLNNPWYWPKVWSYNPALDNPNWIRPGSTIRFYPGGDGPVVEQQEEAEEIDTEFVDIPLFEEGGTTKALERMSGLEAAGGRRDFFVPADRVDDAGRILNAPEEKEMLTEYDDAYVKLKKGGAGDTFQIFRPERDVVHPVTGAYLGKIVTLRGEMQVRTVSKDQSLARITIAWDDIARGDYVAQLQTYEDKAVQPQQNTANVKGYLVDHAPSSRSAVGAQYVVIVDKGANDGVKPGNVFTVVRAGDPYTRQYSGMVDEDVGHIMVLECFDKSAKGLVIDSSRELLPGDRIEMRTAP
jgi:hypothetical protein